MHFKLISSHQYNIKYTNNFFQNLTKPLELYPKAGSFFFSRNLETFTTLMSLKTSPLEDHLRLKNLLAFSTILIGMMWQYMNVFFIYRPYTLVVRREREFGIQLI